MLFLKNRFLTGFNLLMVVGGFVLLVVFVCFLPRYHKVSSPFMGDEHFVISLYGNEVITLPLDVDISTCDLSCSAELTNSVSLFMDKCDSRELYALTNGCVCADGYYAEIKLKGQIGWGCALVYYSCDAAETGCVDLRQFLILPNGKVIKSRQLKEGEVYCITHEPLRADLSNMGISPL